MFDFVGLIFGESFVIFFFVVLSVFDCVVFFFLVMVWFMLFNIICFGLFLILYIIFWCLFVVVWLVEIVKYDLVEDKIFVLLFFWYLEIWFCFM